MAKRVSNSFNPLALARASSAVKIGFMRVVPVGGAAGMQFTRPMFLTRTASTGGPATRERICSKRGEKRDPTKFGNTGCGPVAGHR
jgi:hypothetical protein